MNAHLHIQRQSGVDQRKVRRNPDGPATLIASGACPGCATEPFLIRLVTKADPQDDDRTLVAGSRCVRCGDNVGYVHIKADTLFGLREDRAVLDGRWRVY